MIIKQITLNVNKSIGYYYDFNDGYIAIKEACEKLNDEDINKNDIIEIFLPGDDFDYGGSFFQGIFEYFIRNGVSNVTENITFRGNINNFSLSELNRAKELYEQNFS